jgi:hypothetical protein
VNGRLEAPLDFVAHRKVVETGEVGRFPDDAPAHFDNAGDGYSDASEPAITTGSAEAKDGIDNIADNGVAAGGEVCATREAFYQLT